MAELGNIFGGSALTGEQKIEVEMLDYGYVQDCKDWNQLSAIVDVLKSGKEGHYPDLIRVAEEKLIELLPQKEKRRYFSMNHKTTPAEIAEAESELSSWQRTVLAKDESIQHSRGATAKKLVPVRGSGDGAKRTAGDMEAKECDPAVAQDEGSRALLAILNANQRKKFEKMQGELGVADLTLVKRQYKAGLEKTKGNESFRIADNQDAVACYSKSLAYDPTSAVVWANRAMAYIRLELFDLAEADSSAALLLDPSYVKAYSRRGLVRFKRGKYAEAVQDFTHALQLDPGSAELTKLLHTAREKYREVEGISAAVEEEGEDGVEVVEVPGPVDTPDSFEVQVLHVAEPTLLVFPPASALLVKSGSLIRTPNPALSAFVRINVVSDDESDEEEGEEEADEPEEGVGRGSTRGSAFNRITITEDDSSSDSEADGQKAVAQSAEQGEQRAAELKETGNALLKKGDAAGAIVHYTQSLAILPTYLPSLNNRAQAHLTLKAFSLSELDSSAVLNQEPHNVKALYRRALALSAQLRTSEALADVTAVLSLDPQNSLARELHARLSTAMPPSTSPVDPPSRTESSAPPAHAHATIDVQSLRQKAQQLLGDGLNDKVISLLGQYLRAVDQPPFSDLLQSDQTSLLHLLATAYSSTEDYGHAVAVQATILQIDPTNARALHKRAEGQLQLATQTTGEQARRAALQLAEEDIEAASSAQSGGGTEVLGLRQKLLRLRNTVPESPPTPPPSSLRTSSATPASASDAAVTRSTSSRVQSDAQKDLGNKAMTDKSFSTAIMHYSNAIKFDETNLAAFNNRALAHLKLGAFSEAEADATVVIGSGKDGQQVSAGGPGDVQALRLKALCRRAQARRAIGEALLAKLVVDQTRSTRLVQAPPPPAASAIQRVFTGALQDLQTLLKQDPTNKTALAEQKLAKDAQKKAEDLAASLQAVSAKTVEGGTGVPPVAPATDSAKKAPRADINRVSAMFASPSSANSRSSAESPAASLSSPAAFGDLGMVARSSKKLNTSSSSDGTQGTDSAVRSAGMEPVTPVKAATAAVPPKKAVSSPTPSKVLSAAPTEAPKTVYEFERVWRGLKGRPDLFAQYLGCFKKGTYKKVLKEAVSPDLVSFMWKALRDHAPSPQVQLKALNGFSSAPSFALTLSLLPEEDVRCVQSIMAALNAHVQSLPTQSEEELLSRSVLLENLTTLREAYGMN